MKKNMGKIDKIVRIIIALVAVTLFFTNVVTGALGITLMVVAGIFVLTSLVNFCPIYAILGINSCAVK